MSRVQYVRPQIWVGAAIILHLIVKLDGAILAFD
jgi:hypothetical protein